ncbi:putative transmembrane domain-containing protein [Cryptosporidium canis]|uniref:Transmembrane domain-containing protein n=1 Tax=Cryptosporidium canis TaxID=195482 RepID=A0A9D5DGW4_9CRYT|nr:putative transmembrane domain-containing protein [Cryptosporidium canis]
MYYQKVRHPFGGFGKLYLAIVTLLVVSLWLLSLFNSSWQNYVYETKNFGYINFSLSLRGFSIKSKCSKTRYLWSPNASNSRQDRRTNIASSVSLEEFLCGKLNYFNGGTFGEAAEAVCSIDKYQFPNAQAACYNFRMLNIGSLTMVAGIIGCLVCVVFGFITFVLSYRNLSIPLTYAYTTLFGCSNLIAMITLPIYYVNAGGSWIAINSLFSVVHFGYPQFTYISPSVSDIQFFWGYSLAILAFLTSILLPLFGCYFASLASTYHEHIEKDFKEHQKFIQQHNGVY